MTHGSLFSGVGGFDLAAKWCGWTNVFQVEIEDFPTKVLEKNFPHVQRFRDIKEFDGRQFARSIDVLSGGFPCQPFSVAGKRKGAADDRALWPEMLRVIQEIKPRWVVGENVGGFINMALDQSITDLENKGYEVQAFIIPACAVNAPHRRDRVWIVANAEHIRCKRREQGMCTPPKDGHTKEGIIKSELQNYWQRNSLSTPEICRSDDGLPNRVDRLKGLGNAIVPQVAYEIFKAISEVT